MRAYRAPPARPRLRVGDRHRLPQPARAGRRLVLHRPVGHLVQRRLQSWDVYRGSNGANQVFSFVRTGNTNSGTVDIKAVLNWLRTNGWMGDVTLGDVQFGYEITSSSGGMDFVTNSFSVSSS
ncbi:Glycosyl hydrolase family 12 [Nonomuraea jiangxiensis]|uniref:Glycosyl hydrolase family 12 n=1 Tax=Nonomuraea jiangxiensis TaxID=633440 RepID=A0A1G9P4E4_9ACTN|nr:Glycosyl hydrolase family 12 [Nonomuraea jiangxiensis]